MKKFLLLLTVMLGLALSAQATEVAKSVKFSDYAAGTQYAENEEHDLGDGLVIHTTQCHFTTELRIYSSSAHDGYVISEALPGVIKSMSFNMGYKKDTLNVYGSSDGSSWTLVEGVTTTTENYADYSITFPDDQSFTYFKLDVAGTNQIRIASMTVVYDDGKTVEFPTPTVTGVEDGGVYTSAPTITITPPIADNYTETMYALYAAEDTNKALLEGSIENDSFEIPTTTFTETGSYILEVYAIYGTDTSDFVTYSFEIIDNNCATIADFKIITENNGENIEVKLTGSVTVTYQNGNYLYVEDETGALLIYGVSGTYNNGDLLKGDKVGKTGIYNGLPQMASATLPEATAGDAVEPFNMTNEITSTYDATYAHRYIVLENVTFDLTNGKLILSNGTEIAYYNTFKITLPTSENIIYDVVGIYSAYNGNLQILPISFEEVPVLVAPEISPADGQTFGGEIEVTITTNMTDGVEIYYTTDGTTPSKDNGTLYEGAFTINATTDVTVTAIAYDATTTTDVTTVTYTYVNPNSVTKYGLVTSADQLVVGNQYLIGDWDSSYVLGSQKNNNREAVEISKDNDVISMISSDTVVPLELGVGNLENTYSFYDSSENGYLYAVSSNSNYLRVEETLSDNSSASITVSDNGVSTIIFQGTNTRNKLRYNSNSGIFSCYSNGQQDVALYSKAIYYIYLNDNTVSGDIAVTSVVNDDGVALTLCELEEGEWTLEVEDAPATRATTTYTFNKRYAYVPANGQYTIKYSGTDASSEWTPTSMTSNLYFSVAADGTVTGVDEIAVDANAPVEYYNFQGVRVANPEKGMYIRVQGGKATKVILK